MPTLSGLHIYPVKGLRGLDPAQAEIEPWGLAQDRRWLIVDPQGKFVTQRQNARLALIETHLLPDGLRLRLAGLPDIEVPAPSPQAGRLDVVVWRDSISAVPAGPAADDWLSAAIGSPCRLVYMADPERARPVDPGYGRAKDRVSFADGFPMLVTTQASLDDLNARLEHPIPMNRFRPNLVVAGGEAWAEDRWRGLLVGDIMFRVAKECARCIVTTIDQRTAEKSPQSEPLRTLAKFRRKDGNVMFGQNLVPERRGILRVGDPVVPCL